MTQEEMGNAILNIQETLTGMKEDATGMKEDITGMKEDITGLKEDIVGMKKDITGLKEEGRKRDEMLLNVQNILLTMQQDNKERFDNIDKTLKEINKRTTDIENDVSENLISITNYYSKELGSKNVKKFDSKSHMQILEEHEDRISKLESEKVANQ